MKVSDDDVLEINSTRIVDIKRLDKFDKAKLKVESCRSNYIHGDARNFWKFEFLNKIVTNSQKTNLIVPAIMRWNCVWDEEAWVQALDTMQKYVLVSTIIAGVKSLVEYEMVSNSNPNSSEKDFDCKLWLCRSWRVRRKLLLTRRRIIHFIFFIKFKVLDI